MSASPFPETAAPMMPAASPIPIPQRFTHIPAFYVNHPHSEPETITVKQDGVPLLGCDKKPFTVAQVALERRWAIGYDGEVMPQMKFKDLLPVVRLEYISMLASQGRDARFVGDIHMQPVPRVERYVAWTPDPTDDSILLQIGYNPHATDGAVPESFSTKDGEKVKESRIETLCRAYHDPKQRGAMSAREIDEVERHLELTPGAGAPSGSEIATKLEMLLQLKNDGTLSDAQYMAKVVALTGTPQPDPVAEVTPIGDLLADPAPEPTPEPAPTFTAACGDCDKAFEKESQARAEQAVKMHKRHCKANAA